MVDVGVGMGKEPATLLWIGRKTLLHVLVDFLLEVDSNGAVGTDDLISANASFFGNVAAGIRNADVRRVVTHAVMRSFLSGGDQLFLEFPARSEAGGLRLRCGGGDDDRKSSKNCESGAGPSSFTRNAHSQILPEFGDIVTAWASGIRFHNFHESGRQIAQFGRCSGHSNSGSSGCR